MRPIIKRPVVWGSIGFILLISLIISLPWLLNPGYVKRLVLERIQQTFGSHVNVGETTFAFFPSPHFLVSDITIKERPESHAVFRAQSMSLTLGIGQLFQEKLVVKEFLLERPEIEVHRDETGHWRVLGHARHDSSLAFFASFLVLGKLIVNNGKIIVIDESPSDSVRGIVIENVTCISETSYDNVLVHSNLDLSGSVRQVSDFAPFRIKGTFEATSNVPLSDLRSDAIHFEDMAFSGKINTSNLAVNQLAEYIPRGALLAKFTEILNGQANIKWVNKESGSQINLSNISVSNSAITLAGNATIEGLEDGHQMTSLTMTSSNIDLKKLQRVVPYEWLPNRLMKVWRHSDWGGELEILEARFTTSTRSDVDTSLTGKFRIDHGFLDLPELPETHEIRGTVVVDPDRMQILEGHGIYDGIAVQVNEGIFLFNNRELLGTVELQGEVPAKKVWNFVGNLSKPSSKRSIFQTWNVTQGAGTLRLRFGGNILDQGGLTFQEGDYQPRHVTLTIPGLPQPLSHGFGEIQFSPESTVLKEIGGNLGTFPLALSGTIVHQDHLRLEPIQLTAGFAGEHFFTNSAHSRIDPALVVSGPLNLSVSLRGPIDRVQIKGTIDGKHASLSIPSFLQKQSGQSAMLEFDGTVHSGKAIRFKRLELAMLPLRLRGQGTLGFSPTWVWKGKLNSGPISVGGLPEKIQMFGSAVQSGIFEIQLGGNGRGLDWTNWNLSGWLAVTDGVIGIPGISEKLSNLFVRLKIDHDRLDLTRMEFRMNNSQAVLTGFVKDWRTSPQVSLMWEAPRFDIDLLIPKKDRSVVRDWAEWLANYGRLVGSVVIEQPEYKGLLGANMSAVINIRDNLVAIDKIQAMVEDKASLNGRIFVHLPPGKPAAMRASFQANHLPFEKFLSVLGDKQRLISGDLTLRGMIQGHGRHAGGIRPTLHGGMEVELRDGYVHQETILPQILKILNLPYVLRDKVNLEETGFPYDAITTSLSIADGKFSTKNFLLQSPIMKATAAGSYDFGIDSLDGVAAVSPFGAYSETLKAIPLFGQIFSGNRTGIATAMFRMKGSLGKPQIAYLPTESLKAGLTGLTELAFDILKNTVFKPLDVLDTPSIDSDASLNTRRSPTPHSPDQIRGEEKNEPLQDVQ